MCGYTHGGPVAAGRCAVSSARAAAAAARACRAVQPPPSCAAQGRRAPSPPARICRAPATRHTRMMILLIVFVGGRACSKAKITLEVSRTRAANYRIRLSHGKTQHSIFTSGCLQIKNYIPDYT